MPTDPHLMPAAMADGKAFHGEIFDADGHLYLRSEAAAHVFAGLRPDYITEFLAAQEQTPGFAADRARNRSEFWDVKGLGALGAYDLEERIEALGRMGVRSQLVFRNNGFRADGIDAARAGWKNYADFALEVQQATQGRAQMVIQVDQSDAVEACRELDRIIARGARAISLMCATPPAGVSPAHELWDPFYARLEEADVVLTLHLGCGGLLASPEPMFPDKAWGDAASLRGQPGTRPGGEEAISPYFMLVAPLPAELFLQTLIMGSVFERFPRLRMAIVELGAGWVGPLVERMDLWVDFMAKIGRRYAARPSDTMARNVRVTPFWHENIQLMIERYGLDDVYVFSSDYPHLEGSRDPFGKFAKKLQGMPADYARRFYVDNARLLFPHVT